VTRALPRPFFFFRQLDQRPLGQQQNTHNRDGILQRDTHYLCSVDDPSLNEIHIFAPRSIEAIVSFSASHAIHDHSSPF
jgi:hypothetical protein